jgi:signal transduction histidine kinase
MVCAGACLLIALALYRFRMFRLKRQLKIRFQERLAERRRIAQELHDTLLQSFQGLLLCFQSANETVLSDPAAAKEYLEHALDRADQALVEGRRAIQGFRSIRPAGCDLANCLHAMMNLLIEETRFGKASARPNTSVVAEGQPRTVNPWIGDEVCKIAKEALWNAASHARAQHIESEIAYSGKFLRVRFRDDGIGIDSLILRSGGRTGHWGITGMNERARNIHGRLSICSRPGGGTEVELTVPGYIAYEKVPWHGWLSLSLRKAQVQYGEQL